MWKFYFSKTRANKNKQASGPMFLHLKMKSRHQIFTKNITFKIIAELQHHMLTCICMCTPRSSEDLTNIQTILKIVILF